MMVESLVPALDGRLVTLFEGLGSLRGEDGLEGTKVAHANTVADLHVVDKAVDERVEHGLGLRRVHATRVAALLHQLGEGHLWEGELTEFEHFGLLLEKAQFHFRFTILDSHNDSFFRELNNKG